MTDFENIWQRIEKFQGEIFYTKSKLDFTYKIAENFLIPSRANFSLSKENFKKAFEQLPMKFPSKFSKDIMGTSYVWGIFSDKRIIG